MNKGLIHTGEGDTDDRVWVVIGDDHTPFPDALRAARSLIKRGFAYADGRIVDATGASALVFDVADAKVEMRYYFSSLGEGKAK